MSYRRKMSRHHSKRSFSRGANRVHRKNVSHSAGFVSRGGIRL